MGAFLGCDCGSELELGVSTLLLLEKDVLENSWLATLFILFSVASQIRLLPETRNYTK
jgi:hypothetical protein